MRAFSPLLAFGPVGSIVGRVRLNSSSDPSPGRIPPRSSAFRRELGDEGSGASQLLQRGECICDWHRPSSALGSIAWPRQQLDWGFAFVCRMDYHSMLPASNHSGLPVALTLPCPRPKTPRIRSEISEKIIWHPEQREPGRNSRHPARSAWLAPVVLRCVSRPRARCKSAALRPRLGRRRPLRRHRVGRRGECV